MSLTNGTGRRRPPPDLDGAVSRVVEYLNASDTEDRGWRRSGSKVQSSRTLADLAAARTLTRQLLDGTEHESGNEFALGAAANLANYAVGEAGLKYEAIAAPVTGVHPAVLPTADAAVPALVAQAQEFVNTFTELNDLPAVEWESVWRLAQDGDAPLRLFPGDGVPEVRFVEPERIAPPEERPKWFDLDCDPDDSWGVVFARGDRGRRVGYWVEDGPGGEVEFVPEREVVFLKVNTLSHCPRGWPTWEPAITSLRRAEELSTAMTKCGIARAKIALITKMKSFTQEKADAIKNRLTSRTVYDGSGIARVESVDELPYSSRIRIGADDEWIMPNHSLGSADLIEAIEANLRKAAARANLPQWMFSQKTDVKYSNAFTVEAPAHRSFKTLQRVITTGFGSGRLRGRASLVWRAVRMGVAAGLLPAAVLTAVRIKCTAPSLETRDKNAEASANVAYIGAGVKPVALVQQELGIDPEEAKKLAAKYPAPAAGKPPADPGPGPTGATPAAESVAEGGPATGGTFPGRECDGPAPGWE